MPVSIEQRRARFRNDDGSESSATWKAAQDTNVSLPASSVFRLRILMDATADPSFQAFQLAYKKNSGGYNAVLSSAVPTLAYGAEGAVAYSANNGTTVAPAYPTGITANRSILLMIVGQKPTAANTSQVTTPTGWTLVSSLIGAGGYSTTLGADTGDTNLYVFSKDTVAGTETGTVSVTLSSMSTTGITWAQILRIESPVDMTPSYAAATTSQTTTPTSPITLTFGSNPGVTAGDYVIAAFCTPTDIAAGAQYSSESFSQTGVTFGTVVEVSEPTNAQGNDIGGVIVRAPVTAGTSSAAPSLQMTLASTLTNVRGPAIFVRVRATPLDTSIQLSASANIAASAATATTAQLTPPTGKTTAVFTAGWISDDTNPLPAIDTQNLGYTEVEWCLAVSAGVTIGDVFSFAVLLNGSSVDAYTLFPSVTIVAGGASAAFAGVGVLSGGTPNFNSSVTFPGVATLSGGTPRFNTSAAIAGTAVLATTPVFNASASFAGTSSLATNPSVKANGSVTFPGIATLSGGNPTFQVSTAIAGVAVLSAGTPQFTASASFVGTAALSSTPVFNAAVSFAGTSSLTASNPKFQASETFAGTSALAATPVFNTAATLVGTAVLSAGTPALNASAAFAGTGALNAVAQLDISASFAGTSTLSAGIPQFDTYAVLFEGFGLLDILPASAITASASFLGTGYLLNDTPLILHVTATNVTGGTADITWDTNSPTDTKFEYGPSTSYGTTIYDATLVTNHAVSLTGLPSETQIFYRITAATSAAYLEPNFLVSVSFAGTSTFAASPVLILDASVSFAGAGTLDAGNPHLDVSAAIAGTSTLVAVPQFLASAAFVGASLLVTTYEISGPAAAGFLGGSSLTANAFLSTPAAVDFVATGGLSAIGYLTTPASVTMAGAAVATFEAIQIIPASATFTGVGTLDAAYEYGSLLGAVFSGAGSLAVNPTLISNASIVINGAGALTTQSSVFQSLAVGFAGVAILNAAYAYGETLSVSAAFAGFGHVILGIHGYSEFRDFWTVTTTQPTAFSTASVQITTRAEGLIQASAFSTVSIQNTAHSTALIEVQ